ncbi:Glutamine synthetase, catalytic domain containing protein [Trichomonas vaginalis G3]|uniref:Glutamine synthetase, catalytic domain containing protein n=1 Tax=Trichomonas vaginalis (strain ATCC PRA-98 / G3) TaxID=412133 RepID=A2FAG1_TRIV3|nr:glutamine synthetase family [Trichomonas vaginalis G3]EAX98098.1 Glutamine synthetase, catalytic domain containing protein [Trichomonas vaginalis G3]KAI5484462.1 glutamine synthetase family [Trichomonas vaginalis G3]|eukprot:XP_001311028.1 Glutamine synthetase, catalytic domain containing protein [Trichomonas vaginalis G3]
MESALDLKPIYGSKVFREAVIRMRLNKKIYQSYLKTIETGSSLDVSIAPDVAKAMMEWAIENGATHYAHWFLPMTDVTACKHDSFFTPTSIGESTLEFPPSTLVKGEPDASSFPSGGLRATFEARGYTTWDPTSPAFVKDGTLFIPSVFVSYNGEALDRKLPLLRSVEALNREGLRFIKFFKGQEDVKRITASVGAEQEYFLIDRKHYEERLDLKMCGRTLLGAKPPKAQQLDDHYMSGIKIRVSDYMKELDHELWELGIPAKTKHNEVAPSQHELAPVYENVNIAADHNQMTMELMRTIAKKKGLALLLHEKPFAYVNGSGKHNNYSLGTDTGVNLLQPRDRSEDDGLFLLVLCAFLLAVDNYGDLIRMAAASHSNDQRLGVSRLPLQLFPVSLAKESQPNFYPQQIQIQSSLNAKKAKCPFYHQFQTYH